MPCCAGMDISNLTLIVSLILLVTVVTTPITVTEDSFARYQRHTGGDLSQAVSVRNSCLNPASNSNTNDNMISNGSCGGTISQQGGSGQTSTPTTVQNANPTIEVQRSTTTQLPITGTHETCMQCFDMLNATQQRAANEILNGTNSPLANGGSEGLWPTGITTLNELCNVWNKFTGEQRGLAIQDIAGPGSLLDAIGVSVDSATSQNIVKCLLGSVG